MKRLLTTKDTTFAFRLEWKLQDAGIKATMTMDQTENGVYAGQRIATIWVDDDTDTVLARDIYVEEVAASHGSSGAEGTASPCGAEQDCPEYGEAVPTDFDICWNCGATVAGNSAG